MKTLIFLSGLFAATAPLTPFPLAAESRAAFSLAPELFESLPGDRISTETGEKGKALRWDIRYPNRQNRALVKPIPAGLLKGTTGMSFWARSITAHPIWVQVNDADGEGFYKIISVAPG